MGLFKNYRLKDGSIYWHKLYYNMMPKWMTEHSPKYGDYNYAYYLYHPHSYVGTLIRKTQWFFQRGTRGYADCDVWSLDGYILGWLPNALDQLRKECHGYPCDLSPESWDYILEKMADGLKAESKWCGLDYETERERIGLQRRGKDGMRLLFERWHDLWD